MEIKELKSFEKRLLNLRIIEYNESRIPLPVFLEIMRLDLTGRPKAREGLCVVIEKIARLQPVEYIK